MFGSHIFDYEDGKLIFETGAWLLGVVILGTALFS
jgi:hypothetical protein